MTAIWLFLTTYLVVGSIWFWLTLLASVALGLACVAKEAPITLGLLLAGTIALVFGANSINPIEFVVNNWPWLVAGALAYLPLGAAFSLARWRAYAVSKRDAYDQCKRDFLEARNIKTAGLRPSEMRIPDELMQTWLEHLSRKSRTIYPNGEQSVSTINPSPADLIPQIAEHKARAINWIIYWPWHLCWHLIKDSIEWIGKSIKRIAQNMWYRLRDTFESIANSAWKGVDDDKRDIPAPPPADAEGSAGGSANGSPSGKGASASRGGLRDTVQ